VTRAAATRRVSGFPTPGSPGQITSHDAISPANPRESGRFRELANSIYSGAMNARNWVLSCMIGTGLFACGGAAIPQDALTAAQADVKGAEVGGAADNPQAALHLKLAKDQIEKAQKEIADGDNEKAARTLDRAQADAELALALAKEGKAQGDASEAAEQVGKLRKEISK